MDLGLKGKNVLITGATRGIGRAVANLFMEEGAEVSFCARREAEVLSAVSEWEAKGYSVRGTTCDVSDPTSYKKWLLDEVNQFGALDVFVPNVSGGAQQGDEGWKTAFETDLMATVNGCETLLPSLAASKGAIVVIASIAGLEAMGGPSAYNTVKAGLIAYASQLGDISASHGVRVNSVSPGPVHVEGGFWGAVKQDQAEVYQAVCAQHPMGRLATPEEVANAVVFLASERSSWITRTNLIVDGGFTRRVQF